MSDTVELEAAAAASREAKARLRETIGELQSRLEPQKLIDEAVGGVKASAVGIVESAGDKARRRPGIAIGLGVTALAVLLHRPIGRVLARVFRRPPPFVDERHNSIVDAGLYHKERPSRRRQRGKDGR